MTAFFVVFIEQWMKEKKHLSAFAGNGLSTVCLIIFGGTNFIIHAMLAILGMLAILRKSWEKVEVDTI